MTPLCLATTLYVSSNAPAGGDGQSWSTAYACLQDALAVAAMDPNVTEIHVSQGIYKPDRSEYGNVLPGNRWASFHLRSGLAVLNGYAGPGVPSNPDTHDTVAFETTLSGDLLGDDGPNFANNAENSLHVVMAAYTDATAVLDGFTIAAGNANGTQTPDDAGGGLRCDMYQPLGTMGHPTVPNASDVCPYTPVGLQVDAAGRSLGDWNENCTVDFADFEVFEICFWYSGPDRPSIYPREEVFDFEADSGVVLRDFALFQAAFGRQ